MATFLVTGFLTQEDGVCAWQNSARIADWGRAMRAKKNNIGNGYNDFTFLSTTQLDALMLF